MAPNKKPVTVMLSNTDRLLIEDAAAKEEQHRGEFMRLVAVQAAKGVITKHKHAKRTKRMEEE